MRQSHWEEWDARAHMTPALRHFGDHIFSQPFLHLPFFGSSLVTILGSLSLHTNHIIQNNDWIDFQTLCKKSLFFTSLLLKLSEEEILNNINVFPPTPEKLGTLPNTPATPVTERRGRLAPLTLFQQSWQGQSLKLASASSHLLFKTTPTTSTQKSWKSFDHRGSNLSILGYFSLLPHTLLAEWTLCKKIFEKGLIFERLLLHFWT